MKTAVVYYSKHHGNTKKLLDAIAAENEIDLIDVTETPDADLSGYVVIGFASGIYYSKFQKSLLKFAEERLPEGPLYLRCGEKGIYGCDRGGRRQASRRSVGRVRLLRFQYVRAVQADRRYCKGHPNTKDLEDVQAFYRSIAQA